MSLFTPPTDKERNELEFRSQLIDMIGEALLESNMPEEHKIGVRVLLKCKEVKDTISRKIEDICNPEREATSEIYAKQSEALELLTKMQMMLADFDETINGSKETTEIKE